MPFSTQYVKLDLRMLRDAAPHYVVHSLAVKISCHSSSSSGYITDHDVGSTMRVAVLPTQRGR